MNFIESIKEKARNNIKRLMVENIATQWQTLFDNLLSE